MRLAELTDLLQHLRQREVRFLVAGGLAVVAHGHTRVTHDLDLVLAMDPQNLTAALDAFADFSFRPRLTWRMSGTCLCCRMKRVEEDPGPWKAASFEGARVAQTREAARRLTPYERIRWCCEMSEAIRLRTRLARDGTTKGA